MEFIHNSLVSLVSLICCYGIEERNAWWRTHLTLLFSFEAIQTIFPLHPFHIGY